MFTSLFTRRSARKTTQPRTRRLAFMALEERTVMAALPLLSSLPGAAQTIYLDFDGDTQPTWNRTDSNQTYTNVIAGEFNLDNTAGFSTTEADTIRKIWETVADDYAPFNVNVTTVAPTSFANRVALRVVMCGATSATLTTSTGQRFNSGTRDVFISDDAGTMVKNSGYAALNSYTNAEPNVVYVFAKLINNFTPTDSEGRFRDPRAVMANTASHEAGHAFGLIHHGDYDVGSPLTTPIMGLNTQGDRTLWSTYTVNMTSYDTIAQLTSLLGARRDDFSGSLGKNASFPLTYDPIYGWTGMVKGVIGTTTDTDLFRFTTTATNTYQINVIVPQFGNLDSQLVLYRIRSSYFGTETLSQITVVDPEIPSWAPFGGLGATLTTQLGAGTWAIAVRSHGGYSDIGNYTLTVTVPSSQPNVDVGGIVSDGTTITTPPPKVIPDGPRLLKSSAGAGAGGGLEQLQVTSPKASTTADETSLAAKTAKRSDHDQLDAIFAAWPSALKPVL